MRAHPVQVAPADRWRRGALILALAVSVVGLSPVGQGRALAVVPATVSMGSYSACGLNAGGGVLCWGYNGYGQLGRGDTVDSNVPTQVSGMESDVVAVSVGSYHACAIKLDGSLWCWGYNYDGELGDNTLVARSTPVQVTGFDGTSLDALAVSAGQYHTCAVTSGGGVRCWGSNSYGQLGDGTTTVRKVPTQVSGLTSGSTAVSAGGIFSCAIANGAAKCWGAGFAGQLGYGGMNDRLTPVQVRYLTSGVTALATGYMQACAIVSGALKCWGYNANGQLGDGSWRNRFYAVQVKGLTSGVTAVSAGGDTTCAVVAGAGRCWGYNASGQVGDGTTVNRNEPSVVAGLPAGVAVVDAGLAATCAAMQSGSLRCWGDRTYGLLGDGQVRVRTTPTQVVGLSQGVSDVDPGLYHACAVADGGVKCWGSNGSGQLGNGTWDASSTPSQVQGLTTGIVDVESTEGTSCALTTGGEVWCWGDSYSGGVGDGSFDAANTPVQPVGLPAIASISAGLRHVCAVGADDGSVWCWGFNGYGQLGDGTTDNSSIPLEVPGLANVATVATGGNHTCVLTTDGDVSCWGKGFYGQLGDGTNQDSSIPIQVSSDLFFSDPATAITAGEDHTCAVVLEGVPPDESPSVWCWGADYQGQSAGGGKLVGISSGVTSVVAGTYHTCAIVSGGAQCWGRNQYGELGDGTLMDRGSPAGVSALSSGVTRIGAAQNNTCAVVSGAAKCWGDASSGQLGIGDSPLRELTPVSVFGWTYAPDPPTAITVSEATTSSVKVSFTPASDDGGSVVTSFTATCTSSNGGDEATASTSSSPVQVTGLTTGKIYTCSVVATNGIGDSAPSSPSAPFIPAPAPTITSFTPTSGNKGTAVTITGTNFAPGATCKFNATTATVCAFLSTTSIVTSVPTGATSGKVSVITAAGTAQSSTNMSVGTSTTAPTITSFSPTAGVAGTQVTITGTNLAGATAVKIGTVTVTSGWTVLSAGQIRVPVPAGSTSGTVAVTTVGTPVTTSATFTVYVAPSVTSFTPTTQIAGLPITITGTGLLGVSEVSFNGTTATPTSVTATSISVPAPRGSTTGKITVTNPAGSSTSASNFTPIRYAATQVAAGTSHACARLSGGTVRCWGLNGNGQLGDGTTTQRPVSVPVTGLTGVALVVAGGAFTCALLNPGASGTAKCWGLNTNGQLGDGSTTQSLAPVTVTRASDSATLTGIANMVAGTSHACALMEAGSVYCWGLNSGGRLGDGTTTQSPRAVRVVGPVGGTAFLEGVAQIAAGGGTTCAQVSGAALCWGLNASGQVGDGSITNRRQPTQVTGLTSNVANVAVGGSHACAVLLSTEVRCWGLNTSKQLGDGTTTSRTTPVAVRIDSVPTNLTGVSAIVAGTAFTCALLTSEKVRCWGANSNGQLGVNSTTAQAFLGSTVLPVTGAGELSGVRSIAAGGAFVVALAGGDAAEGVTWGLNTNGQLGDNTLTQRLRPVYTLGF